MQAAADKNILVISDLHLGEDLRPAGTNLSYLRRLAQLERELESFLVHYSDHRIDGRPWRLVVNGDMVDFMSVMVLLPKEEEATAEDRRDEDNALYGLGFSERAAQKKLERVIVRHPTVFRRLAEFVALGNELAIVIGNHDAEFHYESVQTTFRQWLCALALGAGTPDGAPAPERDAYLGRIQFCPWFFYEKDVIYIEHGHQYDEYCSFDYQLHPIAAQRAHGVVEVALSVSHAGMRYFANQLPDYDPRTAEKWSVANYARWAWAMGLGGAARCFYLYALLIWRLVEAWYRVIDRRVDSERRARHQERLRALSSQWQIAEEKLASLDQLRRMPVTRSLTGILFALFVDRIVLGVITIGAIILGVTLLPGPWRAFVVAPAVGAYLLNRLLNRVRLEACAKKLRAMPRRIAEFIKAPLVVFGHSHEPERVTLDNVTYVNTGSWADEYGGKRFTHLRVLRRAGAELRAELCAWENGVSSPIALPLRP